MLDRDTEVNGNKTESQTLRGGIELAGALEDLVGFEMGAFDLKVL
jgi:hypothetical protein